jgi:hypothetical protein
MEVRKKEKKERRKKKKVFICFVLNNCVRGKWCNEVSLVSILEFSNCKISTSALLTKLLGICVIHSTSFL